MKERDIIDLIKNRFKYTSDDIIIGPGDDCAVIDLGCSDYILVSVDDMVDGTHFISSFLKPCEIASRFVRVNLSDIYSMGNAVPKWCLVSMGLNQSVGDAWIKSFLKSLKNELDFYNVKNIGGNLVRSPVLFLSMNVFGNLDKNGVVMRKGAKKGDLICIVGKTGFSSAAVDLMRKKKRNKLTYNEQKIIDMFSKPHIYPDISKKVYHYATTMIDNSDGIFKTLEVLCNENNLMAVCDMNSILKTASECVINYYSDKNELVSALLTSDDYNLVFSISESDYKKIADSRIKVIGHFEKGSGVKICGYEGKAETFEHF
ncbi:MAG: thiamine-phosphate kinase [Elusimicrobiales bacterium]